MCDTINKVNDILGNKKDLSKVCPEETKVITKNGEIYERINKTIITEDNKVLLND